MHEETVRPMEVARDALVRAGWHDVAQDLIRGLVHDLSGLAGTIPELASSLGEPDSDDVRELLVGEARRLPGLVRLLRGIVGEPAGMMPIEVRPCLESAVTLHGYHHGLRGQDVRVDVPDGTPPVRSDPLLLSRLLLIVLAEVGRSQGRGGALSVTVHTDAGRVGIGVEASGDGDEETVGADSAALAEAVRHLGAELGVEAGPHGRVVTLSLPAL